MLVNSAYAKPSKKTHADNAGEQRKIIVAVDHVLDANRDFVKRHSKSYFLPFIKGQTPKATVLGCADSRVHSHAIDPHPDGDLFFVRNIGNQIVPVRGSIEYGVRHLHTPLLLVLGHTMCGAVRAAMQSYSEMSPAIKTELDNMHVPHGDPDNVSLVLDSVEHNINHQIDEAMNLFADELKQQKLIVIGAVYDFRNDYHQGYGRLVIINVNGSNDVVKIKESLSFSRKKSLNDVFIKK
ncbi:MAG: carbonic anhydrase [Methylococcales bacterium]|nr:carbonic anhydrase [Methylococcales bacterium]